MTTPTHLFPIFPNLKSRWRRKSPMRLNDIKLFPLLFPHSNSHSSSAIGESSCSIWGTPRRWNILVKCWNSFPSLLRAQRSSLWVTGGLKVKKRENKQWGRLLWIQGFLLGSKITQLNTYCVNESPVFSSMHSWGCSSHHQGIYRWLACVIDSIFTFKC